MFKTLTLDYETNLFPTLSTITKFEPVIKGRQGTVLVDSSSDTEVPIVRTTTKYTKPAQKFKSIHREIATAIATKSKTDLKQDPELKFNNALIEIYDDRYRKMGFHSDQALDLVPDSHIAIFTCYEDPTTLTSNSTRKLIVIPKSDPKATPLEIPMTHNSVIMFSLETNSKHLHKIVLTSAPSKTKNRWLGITFRQSTPIDPTSLRLATEEECKQFYMLRSTENRSQIFTYPPLEYTISPSDLLKPTV